MPNDLTEEQRQLANEMYVKLLGILDELKKLKVNREMAVTTTQLELTIAYLFYTLQY